MSDFAYDRIYYQDNLVEFAKAFSEGFENKQLKKDFVKSAENYVEKLCNSNYHEIFSPRSELHQIYKNFAYGLKRVIFTCFDKGEEARVYNGKRLMDASNLFTIPVHSYLSFCLVLKSEKFLKKFGLSDYSKKISRGNNTQEDIHLSNSEAEKASYTSITYVHTVGMNLAPIFFTYMSERMTAKTSFGLLEKLIENRVEYNDSNVFFPYEYFDIKEVSPYNLEDILLMIDEISKEESLESYPVEWLTKSYLGV